MTVTLNRVAGEVSGTVEHRYLGIPIYWQHLANVHRVEKRERPIMSATSRKGSFGPTGMLSRVVFWDANQEIIAWGEEKGLLEAVEPMQKFLASQETQFDYDEKIIGNSRDLTLDRIKDSFFALMLLVGGGLWFWGALDQMKLLILERRSNSRSV